MSRADLVGRIVVALVFTAVIVFIFYAIFHGPVL